MIDDFNLSLKISLRKPDSDFLQKLGVPLVLFIQFLMGKNPDDLLKSLVRAGLLLLKREQGKEIVFQRNEKF